MSVLDILAVLLALPVLLPAAVLFMQVLAALLPGPMPDVLRGRRPSVAVLIPAHDEADGIADTLHALREQLVDGDRLLVVADNCTDETAAIASACGAEVVERADTARRGKGYALDFGIRHLSLAPPEIVIVVDADCHAWPGTVEALASACAGTARPVQALDLMLAPEGSAIRMRVAEFAWRVKNQVRPLGMRRLGLPCQLMGTGMAFPWPLIRDAGLASAELAEDMKLGIDLALAGRPASFCPEARVTSRFPAGDHAVSAQRTRWEHGHLGLLGLVPGLMAKALLRLDARLLGLALDLAVPPLALLAALIVGMSVLTGAGLLVGLSPLPFALAAAAFCLMAISVLAAWAGWGRAILPAAVLLSVPWYVLAKVPMYLRFLTGRQKEWVRTERRH